MERGGLSWRLDWKGKRLRTVVRNKRGKSAPNWRRSERRPGKANHGRHVNEQSHGNKDQPAASRSAAEDIGSHRLAP